MLKIAGQTGSGEPLLLLGLTGENVTRLAAGEPILIRSSELGKLGLPPIVIGIHYGKTVDAILEELKGHGIKFAH